MFNPNQLCSEIYLGEDERDDEVDELEVVASFLFLLFADLFLLEEFTVSKLEVLSPALDPHEVSLTLLTLLAPLPLGKLVLFDLLIFILRLGDSGCCRSAEKLAWPSWSIAWS